MAAALFLLNGLATKEELLEMFPEERLRVAITMFDSVEDGKSTTVSLRKDAEDLKEFIQQHRDAKKSLN